jgi:hypothetical protein
MKPFSSSTKPLLSFAETELLKKLVSACGDRLTELSQSEKYQLSTVISLYLWGLAEDIEQPNPEGYKDGADDDVLTIAQKYLPFTVSGDVKAALFILKDEDPDNLATILSAVNEYAKEDDRLHH